MSKRVYEVMASLVDAYHRVNDPEVKAKHEHHLQMLCKEYLPHGSGFDADPILDTVRSNGDRLVICAYFHHINQDGYYDGWSDLTVTVRPSLSQGFVIGITGVLRKYQIDKEYFYDMYNDCLDQEIKEEK